jgi:hypothetical protein
LSGAQNPVSSVTNLNKARKRFAKDAAGKVAAANRLKYGMTKAEKLAAKDDVARSAHHLDQHRRDTEDERS